MNSPLAAFVFCLTVTVGARATEAFTFAALGCMPYGLPASALSFDRVIDSINRQQPAFTVHLGDTKGGSEPSSEAQTDAIHAAFMRFDGPLIYTPGDNEWTDVHRPEVGGLVPMVALTSLRERFFAEEKSLGRRTISLNTQRRDPAHAFMVENARWSVQTVVFATVHVVGSDNNRQPEIPGALEEFYRRNAANLVWVRETFAEAHASQAPGVALFFQAAPFAEDFGRTGYDEGFRDFLQTVEEEAKRFARPVLLVHADEHRYRLNHGVRFAPDRPSVPNVTRLATFGSSDLHAVLVAVQPNHPEVFLPGPLLVPGNPLPQSFDLRPRDLTR